MPNQIDMSPMPAGHGAPTRPWGFWATLGWTLLAVAAGVLALMAVGLAIARWNPSLNIGQEILRPGGRSAIFSSLLMLAQGVIVAMLVFAARRSGGSALTYLGLVRPRGRYVLLGLLCVVLPLLLMFAHVGFDIRQIVPPEQFGRAREANIWHMQAYLLIISAVIGAPIMEEIVFRGFLYRGLSATRLGVAGTILITSVVWALMHTDKTPAAMFDTAVHGVIWGWLRWYTGSTWVTIGTHTANNAIAVLLSVAAMYGLFG
jgi:CAAX protease family protein